MSDETKAKEWITDNGITAQQLSGLIDTAIDFVDGETNSYMGDKYQHEVCLEIIAPGAAGTYIPEYVADYLGMELPDNWQDDEFIWDDIESLADKVADELHKVLGELNDLDGQFYFGTLEDWGDFALFFCWESY